MNKSGTDTAVKISKELITKTIKAQTIAGEMSFINIENPFSELSSLISPVKYIINKTSNLIKNIKASIKNIKRLIPAVIIAVVWIVLILLPKIGINPLPVKVLSFLTFAQGGLSNNVFRITGGIVGKGVVAYLLTSLVMPLIRGKNPFKSLSNGIKSTVNRYKNIASNIMPLLAGAGISLIAYNFMAGYSSPYNDMAAISALLLTLRAAGKNTGFLIGLINSISGKFKNPVFKNADAKNIIAGMSAGFVLAVPVSFMPFVYIGYLLGAISVIASVVLLLIKKQKVRG